MARTHYENLKVTQAASATEIKRAYRALAQQWHPDKNTHRTEEAENNIKIINEAYRVLSNPELRQDHDTWIDGAESDHAAEQGSVYDEKYRKYYDSEGNPYIRKRKRTIQTGQSYRVSKKTFAAGLIALIGIPAVLTAIFLNADRILGLIDTKPSVAVKIPGSVVDSADASDEIVNGLSDFFEKTNRTLLLITDTNTAVAALPGLKTSNSFVVDLGNQLGGADRSTRSSASKAVSEGMRDLRPQLYRLQNESRLWDILYPTINPMLQTLRRMAE